mgnify:CR=1 FL=1
MIRSRFSKLRAAVSSTVFSEASEASEAVLSVASVDFSVIASFEVSFGNPVKFSSEPPVEASEVISDDISWDVSIDDSSVEVPVS